jgi:hypothetical protein
MSDNNNNHHTKNEGKQDNKGEAEERDAVQSSEKDVEIDQQVENNKPEVAPDKPPPRGRKRKLRSAEDSAEAIEKGGPKKRKKRSAEDIAKALEQREKNRLERISALIAAQGDATKAKDEHRHSFEKRIFQDDSMDQEQNQVRKHFTAEKIDHFIRILRDFESSRDQLTKPVRKRGYQIYIDYKLKEVSDEDGVVSTKLFHKSSDTLIIPNEEIFDCIDNAHKRVNHKGIKITYDVVSKQDKVYSVTEEDVKNYIMTCPVCLAFEAKSRKQIPTKVEKQPPVASTSTTSFRDRFELELIDFTNDPGVSANGTTFPWLMSLKDIDTGKIYLRPLQSNLEEEKNEEVSHILGYLGITVPCMPTTRDFDLGAVNRPAQQTKDFSVAL